MTLKSDPIEIVNKRGLHARASAALARLANGYSSKITVTKRNESVPAGSIMGLMMLGAAKGESVVLEADGDDEAEAIAALVDLISNRFGEGE